MVDRILVWKNKHTTDYFDASTPAKLEKAARKVIHSLVYDYEYIYKPDEEPSKWDLERLDMELVNMDDEAVAALPETFQKKVKTQKTQHARLYKQIEDDMKHYRRAKDFADGKVWEEKFKRQDKYDEETWKKILEKWPELPVRDGWMYREVSAWSFLQERNGYEYEDFSLEDVEGDDEE